MTKAYLIKLSGMGDSVWVILNQNDWDFLDRCHDWMEGEIPPVPPEGLISDLMSVNQISRNDVLAELSPRQFTSSYSNDIALQMVGSLFGGERFLRFDSSVKELNKFVAKHDLDLEEAYQGFVY